MAVGPVLAGLGRDLTDSAATPVLIGGAMFLAVIFFIVTFRLLQTKVEAAHSSVSSERRS